MLDSALDVLAVVVSKGKSPHLDATLAAVSAQSYPIKRLIVVDVSKDGGLSDTKISGGQTACIAAPEAPNFGRAIETALTDDHGNEGLIWLLHDDCEPNQQCLAEQVKVFERGVTVGIVGPKQMAADGKTILEAGIQASRAGARLEIENQIDQGQFDSTEDVLAVGTCAMLISRRTWDEIGGFDPVLGPFGDGLELCRRAYLRQYRVVLAPQARVIHHRISLNAKSKTGKTALADIRAGEYHNRILAAGVVAFIFSPLIIIFLGIWRSLVALADKEPLNAEAEIRGSLKALWRFSAIMRGRARISRQATVPQSILRSLETPSGQIRYANRAKRRAVREAIAPQALDQIAADALRIRKQRSFAALATLFAGISILGFYLSWHLYGTVAPVLPESFADLWESAWSGWISGGDGHRGPVDPFIAVQAIFAAPLAIFFSPAQQVQLWWLAAAPTALISGWIGLGIFIRTPWVRGLFSGAWACSPLLLTALAQQRLADFAFLVAFPLFIAAWAKTSGIYTGERLLSGTGEIVHHNRVRHTASAGTAALLATVMISAFPISAIPAITGALLLPARARGARIRRLLSLLPALTLCAPFFWHIASNFSARWQLLLIPPFGTLPPASANWKELLLGIPSDPRELIGMGPIVLISVAVVIGISAIGTILACLRSTHRQKVALGAIIFTAFAMILAFIQTRTIAANGTQMWVTWSGSAIGIALFALFVGGAIFFEQQRIKTMRILVGLTGVVIFLSTLATAGMWSYGLKTASEDAGRPVVHKETVAQVPASAQYYQSSQARGRTLVLTAAEDGNVKAQLLRGPAPLLTDTSTALRRQTAQNQDRSGADLATAIAIALSGGPNSEDLLGAHAVEAIVVTNCTGTGAELCTGLDEAKNIEPLAKLGAGAAWRVQTQLHNVEPVRPANARVRIISGADLLALPSDGQIGLETNIPSGAVGRTLELAERADANWRATLDGKPLKVRDGSWNQRFELPANGGKLVLTWDTPTQYLWRLASWTLLICAGLASIPTGARR